jgi:hypothetical protein
MLLAASRGIQRVHFHHGRGFRYNTLQPTKDSDDGLNITHPHILPSYHALLIVNEAIGKSGNSWVAEIPTTNISTTAYGIWEHGKLKRLVVMNSKVFLGGGDKPQVQVKLTGWGEGAKGSIKMLRSNLTTSNTGL